MQLSTTLRNSLLSAVSTAVGASGTLTIATGSAPGVGNSLSGTTLAILNGVGFGTPSAGSMTVTASADTSADNSGTPGYYRISTSGGTGVIEGPAGAGQELAITGTISLGGTVTLSSGSITAGNS